MKDWQSVLLSPNTPLLTALRKIDGAATQMALIVDNDRRLLGTLTDGDVRRGLIAGMQLDDAVERCMHRSPMTARAEESRVEIIAKMRKLLLHQIPVIDDRGRVIDLRTIDEYLAAPRLENWVVIMAGGLGTRLRRLTQHVPKPMLTVGNRPILETVVRRLVEQGFQQLWLAVNYRAEQIEEYFGDGSRFGATIRYLREEKRLGTAGALSLLPEKPRRPLLVTNADLLVTIDYVEMLEAHLRTNSLATMAVCEYEYQIPYGVVRSTDGVIERLEEKPAHCAMVNAGIYVLSSDALSLVPSGAFFDMPELFAALMAEGRQTRCHKVNGYWLDVGRQEDLVRANVEFPEVFL